MATATTAKPDAPAGVPKRDAVTLHNVDWETYCQLRDNPANYHIRIAYLDGDLTLMSPRYVHDGGAERLGLVIRGGTWGLGLEAKGLSTTTLRHGTAPLKGSGKEPDNAFYLGENERRMRKLKDLDLTIDPPPDLAIEVDNINDSKAALPIHARLGVPEVWRYDVSEHALWFGRLKRRAYVEVARSVALPRLAPALVLHALDVLDEGEMDENAWFEWLKGWAQRLPEAPATA